MIWLPPLPCVRSRRVSVGFSSVRGTLATNELIGINKKRFHSLITWSGSRAVVRNRIGADVTSTDVPQTAQFHVPMRGSVAWTPMPDWAKEVAWGVRVTLGPWRESAVSLVLCITLV